MCWRVNNYERAPGDLKSMYEIILFCSHALFTEMGCLHQSQGLLTQLVSVANQIALGNPISDF